jgi:hypothetical protein
MVIQSTPVVSNLTWIPAEVYPDMSGRGCLCNGNRLKKDAIPTKVGIQKTPFLFYAHSPGVFYIARFLKSLITDQQPGQQRRA